MVYLVSSLAWIASFMLIRKYKEKQNLWRALVMAAMVYEGYLCLLGGTMTVLHLPVSIYSILVVNILCILGMLLYVWKKKTCQTYYIRISDTVFLGALIVLIGGLVISRFTPDMKIIFQTIDPSAHLKTAMDFVNTKQVSGMYVSQMLNGLMIEALRNVYSDEMVYKVLIVQYGINLFMAAGVFWAVITKYSDRIPMRILGYVAVLAYVLGYPLNDMLYGFVYLQITVTMICYMIALMQDYMDQEINHWLWGGMIALGCLAVSVGYTLFAPPIYVSVLICILYRSKNQGFSGGKTLLHVLEVFGIPTLLTIWIILIAPKLRATDVNYGTVLGAEGEAYRNLYSDFLLYSIPAIYGMVATIKRKKSGLCRFLIPIFGCYYLLFGALMLKDKVSTYYFYKLNYLLWMLVLVMFAVGMSELLQRERFMFATILSGILVLTAVYASGKEQAYHDKNANYLFYVDSDALFRIYTCNREFMEHPLQKSDALVQISGIVDDEHKDERVIYIGYWENLRWYDALTDQRDEDIIGDDCGQTLHRFYAGEFGEYAVVEKGSENIEGYQQEIEQDVIYENEFAYLIKR